MVMVLVSGGIERVRVFELPCGIRRDGSHFGLPRIALVKWRSSWCEKFHQIYVNGQYAGVTVGTMQRQMVIQMPTSLEYPIRIEVFAIEADEADTDFSSEIDASSGQTGRVGIRVLRGQDLPIGAVAQIYSNNGMGEIDYDNPLSNLPIRIWPCWQDKVGFATCGFGTGDFGFDSGAAVGFGKGNFGHGQFGLDADTFKWVSPPMQAGVYRFGVKIADEAGNESSSSETGQVTVIPPAKPAEQVSISSFNKQINQLMLSVS